MAEIKNSPDDTKNLLFVRPKFSSFSRNIYLNHHLSDLPNLFSSPVQFFGQCKAVYRMDHIEEPHRIFRLIRLEMSDEMQSDWFSDFFNLLLRLLNIIFSQD